MKYYCLMLALLGFSIKANCQTLTLDSYLSSVNVHYPLILAGLNDINKAKGSNLAAKGAFDPNINSQIIATPAGTYVNRYLDIEYQIPMLEHGGYVFTGYRYGQGNFPVYNLNYLTKNIGGLRAGIDIPLLNGREIDDRRTNLAISKINVFIQEKALALVKIQTFAEASMAYWRWVSEGIKVKVNEQLLHLAKQRQQAIIKRYQHGDAAKIEVAENQRFIIQRQAALIQAKQAVLHAALSVAIFYRNDAGDPIVPSEHQLPQTLPQPSPHYNVNGQFINQLSSFIVNHPAFELIKQQEAITDRELNLAKNKLLPKLDMQLYYENDIGHNNSQTTIAEKSLNLSLNFNFPIYQRQAQGKMIESKETKYNLEEQKRLLKDKLLMQAYDMLNQLNAYRQEITMTNNEISLTKQIEQAEKKRFDNGDSNLFLLNQREQATFDTQIRAVNAMTNYLVVKTNLAALCAFQAPCLKLINAQENDINHTAIT